MNGFRLGIAFKPTVQIYILHALGRMLWSCLPRQCAQQPCDITPPAFLERRCPSDQQCKPCSHSNQQIFVTCPCFQWLQVIMMTGGEVQCPISLETDPLCPQITPCGHVFAFHSIMQHLMTQASLYPGSLAHNTFVTSLPVHITDFVHHAPLKLGSIVVVCHTSFDSPQYGLNHVQKHTV